VAVGGPGPSAGTYSYDLETRQVQKLTPYVSQNSAARWLRDSRRLLISYQGRLYLIDTLSLKSREVFSQLPNEVAGFSLSQDERLIVYSLNSREADIWLARPGIRRVEQKQ
jgi:Tol biopolymer transport system component